MQLKSNPHASYIRLWLLSLQKFCNNLSYGKSFKKETSLPPNPEELTTDKVEEVTVQEVVKDERTTKILGATSLLFTIFLFVAFTSYLFTWQEDQDKVHQFGIKIFAIHDVTVSNLLGVLGAYTAHTFMYKGFGLATFLFCTFFCVRSQLIIWQKNIFVTTQSKIFNCWFSCIKHGIGICK
jgi:hypothetical protein